MSTLDVTALSYQVVSASTVIGRGGSPSVRSVSMLLTQRW